MTHLLIPGNFDNGRIEGDGQLITKKFTYSGMFSNEGPIGPGRFLFKVGCEQEGEYILKRTVRRTSEAREVVHLPVWRCSALYHADQSAVETS